MLFRKIHFPASNCHPEPFSQWYLIIRTEEELVSYLDVNSHYMAQAFFSPNTKTYNDDHPGKLRIPVADKLLEMAKNAPHVSKTWPHEVLRKHLNNTGMAMHNALQKGEIQVNEAGGWCFHDSFMRTWPTASVIKDLEQSSLNFPEKDRGKVAGKLFNF